MAKKKQPVTELEIDLSYVSDFFSNGSSNSCNYSNKSEFDKAKQAHNDPNEPKIMRSLTRIVFSSTFYTNKKTLKELKTEVCSVSSNEDIDKIRRYANILAEYIESDHKRQDQPLNPVPEDWTDLLKFDKKEAMYYNNYHNFIKDENFMLEAELLNIMQEMVDEGLSKYIKLNMSYNCWAYYVGQTPYYDMTPQEWIIHRRKDLAKLTK